MLITHFTIDKSVTRVSVRVLGQKNCPKISTYVFALEYNWENNINESHTEIKLLCLLTVFTLACSVRVTHSAASENLFETPNHSTSTTEQTHVTIYTIHPEIRELPVLVKAFTHRIQCEKLRLENTNKLCVKLSHTESKAIF